MGSFDFCRRNTDGRTSAPPGLRLSDVRPTPCAESEEKPSWSGHPRAESSSPKAVQDTHTCSTCCGRVGRVCAAQARSVPAPAQGHLWHLPSTVWPVALAVCRWLHSLELKCCGSVSHHLESCPVYLSPPQLLTLSPAPWSAADWWHKQGQQCSGVLHSLICGVSRRMRRASPSRPGKISRCLVLQKLCSPIGKRCPKLF